jgi:hypothetical protein
MNHLYICDHVSTNHACTGCPHSVLHAPFPVDGDDNFLCTEPCYCCRRFEEDEYEEYLEVYCKPTPWKGRVRKLLKGGKK